MAEMMGAKKKMVERILAERVMVEVVILVFKFSVFLLLKPF